MSRRAVNGAALSVAAAGAFYGMYKSVEIYGPKAEVGDIACYGANSCKGTTACSTADNAIHPPPSMYIMAPNSIRRSRNTVFSPETITQLRCYVYRLIFPRNGETFYLGKGTANRVFDHADGNIESDSLTDKMNRVREIKFF